MPTSFRMNIDELTVAQRSMDMQWLEDSGTQSSAYSDPQFVWQLGVIDGWSTDDKIGDP